MTMTRQEARALIDEIAERMAPQAVRTMRLQQLEKAQIYTTKIAFAAALEELIERIGLPDSSGLDSGKK